MGPPPTAQAFTNPPRLATSREPASEIVHFPRTSRSARLRRRPCAVHHRLSDLRHAQRGDKSNAVLVCHALTGDQYVASMHPVTGKPGWWETMVGLASRSTPTATSSSAPMCSAAAWARPARASINPATGKPYGPRLSRHHHRATWCARKPALLDHLGIADCCLRDRRLDGRHAGAAMGRELSGPRVLGGADRHRRAPLRAEHRLP